MSVEVIIPWRGGCEHREAALAWVLVQWASTSYRVTIAPAPEGEWVKAKAVTPAVATSSAEIVVIADADVWCDDVALAVAAVDDGAGWSIPHGNVHRLTAEATAEVLAGGLQAQDLELTEVPYEGHRGGGMFVLRRDVYLDSPFDPRFVGWGHEDDAIGMALTTLHGEPWRGSGPLSHLWHPPQQRLTRAVGSDESWDHFRRYKGARTDPRAMRALVDEAR